MSCKLVGHFHVLQSCYFTPCTLVLQYYFDGPSFSRSAFSVNPSALCQWNERWFQVNWFCSGQRVSHFCSKLIFSNYCLGFYVLYVCKVFRAPGSISSRGGPPPCHRRRAATTTWLAETSRSTKIHLAKSDRRRRSAPELWGPHGLEEGKGKGYLASSRQYGNALLGIDVKNVFYVFYFKIKNAFFNVFYFPNVF